MRLVVDGLLLILVIVEGWYLRDTRRELRSLEAERLSDRTRSAEVADLSDRAQSVRQALLQLPSLPRALAGGSVLAALDSDEGRERMRRLIADGLQVLQQEQRTAEQQRWQEVNENGRRSAARELGLSEQELRRLEDLGQPLREAQEKQTRGEWAPLEAQKQIARISEDTEHEIRQLLGDDRYQRLEAVRRDHPEYGRYLFALQPQYVEPLPHGVPAVQQGPASANP
jgi:hypothetical protein